MTLTLIEIIGILFIHWYGDFVMQTEYAAQTKWRRTSALNEHIFSYMLLWYVCGLAYVLTHLNTYHSWHLTYFMLITFACHWITDYFTSKLNHRLAEKARATGKWHYFFVSVGFDQLLHYIQLFLTYKLLTN